MREFATELVAEPQAISALTEQVMTFLTNCGVDARATHHVALVLDELLTNVASHSGAREAPTRVSVMVLPDRVNAEVVDRGMMFDPRSAPKPDLSGGVDERPVGGLGLLLVQRIVDTLAYERADERNRTIFSIRRASDCET
ncbi:MAG TPA: ATP-binding protein [Xanthobacteraceae bacterium]|jgi:serine/threonine-protein kinase RsbW|nr:ATP-binding protein [Xanthobacteraceae bacterium]